MPYHTINIIVKNSDQGIKKSNPSSLINRKRTSTIGLIIERNIDIKIDILINNVICNYIQL